MTTLFLVCLPIFAAKKHGCCYRQNLTQAESQAYLLRQNTYTFMGVLSVYVNVATSHQFKKSNPALHH